MGVFSNQKVLGSIIIGFAMMAGAYLVNNFGKTPFISFENKRLLEVANANSALRVAIPVSDSDNDGVEDWQDSLIKNDPLVINSGKDKNESYTPPDTLTGKAGVKLMSDFLLSKTPAGIINPNIKTDKQDIAGQVADAVILESLPDKVYDLSDIVILKNWDGNDVRNYANSIVNILKKYDSNIKNDKPGVTVMFSEMLNNIEKDKRKHQFAEFVKSYSNYIREALELPVPEFMAQNHVNLINSFGVLRTDINAMLEYEKDPMLAIVRFRSFTDDAVAFFYSMRNIYTMIKPYDSYFKPDDPAVYFARFSPEYNGNNW